MKVVFIGAGNLATHFAQALKGAGHEIVQIFSRTMASATELASRVGADPIIDLVNVDCRADLYVFAVKDSVLETLLAEMPATSGIWAHTAGSVHLDVFQPFHADHAVVYPFQTFSKNRAVDFSEIPVFVEANNEANLATITECVRELSLRVYPLSSEDRKYIHLSGVFACNFVNHLYAVSESILASRNIPFEVLLPLIDETARKVHHLSPKEAQTGPAIRYDENVIEKHLSLLTDNNQKAIYELLSKNIHKTNK